MLKGVVQIPRKVLRDVVEAGQHYRDATDALEDFLLATNAVFLKKSGISARNIAAERWVIGENSYSEKYQATKMTYEPEADILRIETGRKPIDYASEMGNVVVHFSRQGKPVYFEILEVSKFLKQAASLLRPIRYPLTLELMLPLPRPNFASNAMASRFAQKGMTYSVTRLVPSAKLVIRNIQRYCFGEIEAGCSIL